MADQINNDPRIQINAEYMQQAPKDFMADPFGFFESEGTNIRAGEIQKDANGNIIDDPTATKLLDWGHRADGSVYRVVAKRVNSTKTEQLEHDPFHEVTVMTIAQEFGLPCARPIARITQGTQHMIVMEFVSGINAWGNQVELLSSAGFDENDLASLRKMSTSMRDDVMAGYEKIGIHNPPYAWKDENWVYQVDFTAKKLKACVPLIWERAVVDWDQVEKSRTLATHS